MNELLKRLEELRQDACDNQENQCEYSHEYSENTGVLDTITLVEQWINEINRD